MHRRTVVLAVALMIGAGVLIPARPASARGVAPYTANGFTSYSDAAGQVVVPGTAVPITAAFSTTRPGPFRAVIYLEVRNPYGQIVHKHYATVTFGRGAALSTTFTAPAQAGAFTVKLAVFDADWSPLFHWNDNAGTINVTTGRG